MRESFTTPELAPPGAGLPWHQAAFGRYLWLPYVSAVSSWDRCTERFEREGLRILEMAARLKEADLARRVLVHGIVGIEDSSRFWSPAMVLEHLVTVGDQVADVALALSHGREPPHHVRIASLKPLGAWPPAQALESYREMLGRYVRRLSFEAGDRHAERRWHHPWFGEITAHQWHCLGGLHQGLHRRQMAAIVRTIDHGGSGA